MVVYFALIVSNSSETKTTSIVVSTSTTNSNTSQIFGDTEFNSRTDFRTYNSYKTMTDNSFEYNLTEASWGVALMLSKSYNSSIYDVYFYTYIKSEDEGTSDFLVFPLTICNEINFPVHLFENFTLQEYLLSQML